MALQAQVNDPFLAKAEFYVDDILAGESDVAPFGVVWLMRHFTQEPRKSTTK